MNFFKCSGCGEFFESWREIKVCQYCGSKVNSYGFKEEQEDRGE